MMLSGECFSADVCVNDDDLVFSSSAEIVGHLAPGTRCKFEGYLTPVVSSMLQPKSYQVGVASPKKKSRTNGNVTEQLETEDKAVLQFTLLDRTGPVCVVLRDKLVDSFMQQLTEQPKDVNLIVSLIPCRVGEPNKNDWNGKLLTAMGVLQGENLSHFLCQMFKSPTTNVWI